MSIRSAPEAAVAPRKGSAKSCPASANAASFSSATLFCVRFRSIPTTCRSPVAASESAVQPPDVTTAIGPPTVSANTSISWRGEAGDPAGAATATEELLADRVRVLGPDHPNTLITRNNQARWRGKTGDAPGAAAAFEELLAEMLRVLGPDHPNTLTTRNNLASWRERAGLSGNDRP